MAEQIPYGVAEGIINKLASLAFREVGRIYGVSAELEKLKTTLECIQAELCDAEERQEQELAVKKWISRLKEVLHDADDLFDDLVIHDLRCKVDGRSKVSEFFSSSNPVIFRHKVARKVEKIRQQLEDVSKEMSLLNLKQTIVISKENESSWRETSSFVLQSEIIGREEDKREVIDLLKQTHTNQCVSLIAIVGIGGFGKTALAQLVYNDAQVLELFKEKRMWVCVSEDFEVKTILTKMLESLRGRAVRNLQLDQLQKELQEELNGKRYMLVLDDVWNESQLKWDNLRTYLMCGSEGSKILVTTRSKIVAQTMGINIPYVLKGLTNEQSRALLKNLAFGGDARRMSPNLVTIGERIAEKCQGVPLAIKTMGGLLKSKNKESEWLTILGGDFWRLCDEKESIIPVLELSYQNLPRALRQCFAYCCLYPKGCRIEKNELIQLWMAQGYLESSTKEQSMEKLGNTYVETLLRRSFFQEASNKFDDIESFKMHDLMHDLAKSIAGKDFCLHSEGKEIVDKPMHISFVSSSSICPLDSPDLSKLRTIIGLKHEVPFSTNPVLIKNLKCLRVLDMSNSSITTLPKSIDKFKHLKYLDLSGCYKLIGLPDSFGNLVGLQTLKLRGCRKLACSEVITKLISLRCLDNYVEGDYASGDMMPAGLGKLTSLQYLPHFIVGGEEKRKSGKLNELKDLNNLKDSLTISCLSLVKDVMLESHEANLKAKEDIRCLNLHWERLTYCREVIGNKNSDSLQLLDNLSPHQNLKELEVTGYPGVRFSSWLSSITNIVCISLYCFPNCQHLPPLERLMCLKSLNISFMTELKYMHYEKISDVFFPSLEKLFLRKCKNLRGWQRLEDDINNHLSLPPIPRLSSLNIDDCPNLTCMPTFPHLIQKSYLISCNVKPLIETCMVQHEPSSFYPLSTLKHLVIGGKIDIEAMPDDWMKNLKSLEHLCLWESFIIPTMIRHLEHLPTQLQQLQIWEVQDNKLDLWKDEDHVSAQCQASLHCLQSLQNISIVSCEKLKALPEQICGLQSLRHIEIVRCGGLESLPEGMRRLTNLQTLRIIDCSGLRDRCQIETGEDWSKIAHIPHIIWQ